MSMIYETGNGGLVFAITIPPLLIVSNIYQRPDDQHLACSDCLMLTADPEDVSLHFHACFMHGETEA